jgi:hypothetical protein
VSIWDFRTHVLCFDLGLAFTQGTLNVFIFTSLMTPETFDKVIKRFFKPGVLEISVGQSREDMCPHRVGAINRHKRKSREE